MPLFGNSTGTEADPSPGRNMRSVPRLCLPLPYHIIAQSSLRPVHVYCVTSDGGGGACVSTFICVFMCIRFLGALLVFRCQQPKSAKIMDYTSLRGK